MAIRAAVLLALSSCMFGQFTRGFLVVAKNTWTRSTLVCRMSSAFEIEQKFALAVDDFSTLKDRLQNVGFEPAATLEMVDWYFDDISEYTLIRQDCWLRYRERKDNGKGQWELKLGRKQSNDKATVYQEIEGLEGVRIACSLLSQANPPEHFSTTIYDFEGHSIPELPSVENAHRLQPFAQIVTSRSSWKGKDGLAVDLDTTDFGYTVGEVEVVVEDENQIEQAQATVRGLIAELAGDAGTTSTAQGKLEYYLEKNRPDVYDMLVDCGIMKK